MTDKLELFIDGKKRYERQQENKIIHIIVKLNGKKILNEIMIGKMKK